MFFDGVSSALTYLSTFIIGSLTIRFLFKKKHDHPFQSDDYTFNESDDLETITNKLNNNLNVVMKCIEPVNGSTCGLCDKVEPISNGEICYYHYNQNIFDHNKAEFKQCLKNIEKIRNSKYFRGELSKNIGYQEIIILAKNICTLNGKNSKKYFSDFEFINKENPEYRRYNLANDNICNTSYLLPIFIKDEECYKYQYVLNSYIYVKETDNTNDSTICEV